MSDDEQQVATETAVTQVPEHIAPRADGLLEALVRVANQSGIDFELPLTLVVNGCVVTGHLIDARQYFREFGKWWNQSGTSEGAELERTFAAFGDDVLDQDETTPFNFIHLKNAYLGAGFGLVPASPGLLWRGRLSHVSGFSLGSMTPGKATLTASVSRSASY